MGLALKAQAQSRATLQALTELKYPRQAIYAGQANIAHGPQQVNNMCPREIESKQNELLEAQHGQRMDTRATRKAASSHSAMEALESVNRAQK